METASQMETSQMETASQMEATSLKQNHQCYTTWLTRRSSPSVINVEHPLHGQQIKGIGHRSFHQRAHSQELVASHGQRFEPSLEWVGDRRKDKTGAQESPRL